MGILVLVLLPLILMPIAINAVLGTYRAGERSKRDDITLRILAESGKPVLIVPPDE